MTVFFRKVFFGTTILSLFISSVIYISVQFLSVFFYKFYGLECQWKLLTCHNSWTPTENYGCEQNNQFLDTRGDWSESLLASLGLMNIPNNNSVISDEDVSSDDYPVSRISSKHIFK